MTDKEKEYLQIMIKSLNKIDAELIDYKVDEVKTIYMKAKLNGQRDLLASMITGYCDHFDPGRRDRAIYAHLLAKAHNMY
jgi:hypothetical protein